MSVALYFDVIGFKSGSFDKLSSLLAICFVLKKCIVPQNVRRIESTSIK
jgi:hypothetical protein